MVFVLTIWFLLIGRDFGRGWRWRGKEFTGSGNTSLEYNSISKNTEKEKNNQRVSFCSEEKDRTESLGEIFRSLRDKYKRRNEAVLWENCRLQEDNLKMRNAVSQAISIMWR